MLRDFLLRAACLLALAAPLAPQPARAQAPPPVRGQEQQPARAFRGLFGGNEADPKSRQALNLSLSFYGAYDDNVLASQSGGAGGSGGVGAGSGLLDPRFQRSGGYGGVDGSLSYRRRVSRVIVQTTVGAYSRYYPDLSEMTGVSSYGSLGIRVVPSARTSFGATGTVMYSPYYAYGMAPGGIGAVPGDLVVPRPEFTIREQSAVTTMASADFQRRLGPRASLSFDGSFRDVNFGKGAWSADGGRRLRDQRVGGLFTYSMTRHLNLRLGYHYREGQLGGLFHVGRPIKGHEIDAGVDYRRSLSITRRTQLGFSTGSTILQTPDIYGAAGADTGRYRTRYGINGTAYLTREIGRSWTLQADYRRGLYLLEGIDEPFFSDAVNLSLGGYAGPRLRFTSNAAYNRGDSAGYSASNRRFGTYVGQAGLQFALVRSAALYTQFFYFRYRFDDGVPLPPGFGREFSRRGVRLGLNLWVPLLR